MVTTIEIIESTCKTIFMGTNFLTLQKDIIFGYVNRLCCIEHIVIRTLTFVNIIILIRSRIENELNEMN